MNTKVRKITLAKHASWLLTAVLIAGCGGGGGDSGSAGAIPPSSGSPADTNHAPTLSGTAPPSVNAGGSYYFQPSGNDPDGDALTYSVQNLPSWASFDATTGVLRGTPTAADVGTYANIVISVSDGSLQTSTSPFSVDVTQVSLGKVTLSWSAPTQNVDGTPLTDLSGYKLYYGTSEGNYPEQITIDNPGIVTYVVENLAPNTYYFVATSYNSLYVESPFSGVAVKVVN